MQIKLIRVFRIIFNFFSIIVNVQPSEQNSNKQTNLHTTNVGWSYLNFSTTFPMIIVCVCVFWLGCNIPYCLHMQELNYVKNNC